MTETLQEARQLCRQVLGDIEWHGNDGYCLCPGPQQHPACLVRFGSDGVPFAYCIHEKCKDAVADANAELRNLCLSSGAVAEKVLTPQDREILAAQKRLRKVEWLARTSLLPQLIRQPVPLDEWARRSPFPVRDLSHAEQSRAFISGLYPRSVPCRVTEKGLYLEIDHLVWIGDLHETGKDYGDHFQTVQDWLEQDRIEGQQVSHCTFRRGPHRRKEAIRERMLLTLESDDLTPEQFGGVVNYMRKYSTLRSVTHTGNKSIHCNFDYICNVDLFAILEGLGCDSKMWKSALTTRLPGQPRKDEMGWTTGKWQELLYLDPKFEVIV